VGPRAGLDDVEKRKFLTLPTTLSLSVEELKEIKESIIEDSQCPLRDMNQEPLKYKSEELSPEPSCWVNSIFFSSLFPFFVVSFNYSCLSFIISCFPIYFAVEVAAVSC
jgi:FtsZ-binding cell division protein ZapB